MDLNSMGNIEVLKYFLSLHYQLFDFYDKELKDDPRAYEYILILKDIMASFKEKFEIEKLYDALFQEAQRRGLGLKNIEREMIDTESFEDWQNRMLKSPTYIREIEATNYLGDYDTSYVDDEVIGFDFPVREACKVLNEKGYITYWSSGNKEDYFNRKGHVIKDKSVAYILIDPENLTDDLKETLLLNGSCNFWGVAVGHQENGKYYGIWAEIISQDALCEDVSNDLLAKALALPTLKNTKKL